MIRRDPGLSNLAVEWIGAAVEAWQPTSWPDHVDPARLASGALLAAVAYDLFQEAFDKGGAMRAGISLAAGAVVSGVVDTSLE